MTEQTGIAVDFQNPMSEDIIRHQAEAAQKMSRTLESGNNPQLIENFVSGFKQAKENGMNNIPLTSDLYAQYSSLITTGTTSDYEKRYTADRSKKMTQKVIDTFYDNVRKDGILTIENLGEFYDLITLHEPLLDSNTRTSIIGLTHVLSQHGYQPPAFNENSHARLRELQKEYRDNPKQAKIEFLKESLNDNIPSRTQIAKAS